MKVLLLNDASYGDMENVLFPVEVEAKHVYGKLYEIEGSEIIRVGGHGVIDPWDADWGYAFLEGEHLEVVKSE